MGIQGLLPFMKKASRPASMKNYKGFTVAIDSYCWLHKGAFSCAEKLAMGEKTDQYVFYCMKYINNLLALDIKPIMVFDGCHLPSKKGVETARRERREVYRKKAAQFMREGKRSEARDCLTKCIDITSAMALELMNACRNKGVDCIVAPYEADAQLAYLNRIGVAQIIITEDSDLLLFGCERVMFKMDMSGNGIMIERSDINKALNLRPDVYSFEKFRYMCILSGCDYLPNLPGIGLGKSSKVFQITRQTDVRQVLKKLPSTLNSNSLTVPAEYIENFIRADNTFLYQLVFCPIECKLKPLNNYPDGLDPTELTYAGAYMPRKKAYQIALGNCDVNNGKKLANFDPENFKPKSNHWDDNKDAPHLRSIWHRDYRPKLNNNFSDNLKVDRPVTKGKEVTVKSTVVQKKRLSLKRSRDEEDEDLTEAMLASMYTENTQASEQDSKRSKGIDMDGDELHIFPPDQKTELPVQKRHSFCDYSSLSDEPCDGDGFKDVKTRLSISPKSSTNKFALSQASKSRDKFNLNVSKKEVRSRFFSAEKPLKKTSFFEALDKKHLSNNECKKEEEEEEYDSDDMIFPSAEMAHSNPDNSSLKKDSPAKSSPYQSFGVSRFKSQFGDTMSKLSSSPGTSKQFKPVWSKAADQNQQDTFKLPSDVAQENSLHNESQDRLSCNMNSIDPESFSLSSVISAADEALDSSAGDITDECNAQSNHQLSTPINKNSILSLSKKTVNVDEGHSTKSVLSKFVHSSSSNAKDRTQDVIDVVAEEQKENSPEACRTFSSASKQSSSGPNAANKTACRTMGLSATKGKKAGKSSQTGDQKTISNFFQKFAYQK